MYFQFPYIPIVPVTTLFLLVLIGVGPASSAFSQTTDQGRITIDLLPDSSPRFFECDVTPTNGTLSIDGLTPEESAQNVLTDGNADTAILGDARFSVNFSEPLFNIPGPELRVTEIAGAEPFESSVDDFNMTENSISLFPQDSNETNSCSNFINESLIDLQEFGIAEGSSVAFISFDNLGEADSLLGADIADISILGTTGDDNIITPSIGTTSADASTPSTDTITILLEGNSLPENNYIPLYDSTPYKIMNGQIAAKFPCNDDNSSDVNVLIGQAPNLAPAVLEFVDVLSSPGDLCSYNVDIASDDTTTITDIAIQNNSTEDIEFPETSSIIITVGTILE